MGVNELPLIDWDRDFIFGTPEVGSRIAFHFVDGVKRLLRFWNVMHWVSFPLSKVVLRLEANCCHYSAQLCFSFEVGFSLEGSEDFLDFRVLLEVTLC